MSWGLGALPISTWSLKIESSGFPGNSLVVHWLGLSISTERGTGLILGLGTKNLCIVARHDQKKKKEKENSGFPAM